MAIKIIAKNKRASFDYFLEDKYEAGLALQGTEVKSLRGGKCSMTESYCAVDKNDEVWIHQLTIPPYEFGNIANHSETRKRKLLLNRHEIDSIKKSSGHQRPDPGAHEALLQGREGETRNSSCQRQEAP